MSFAAFICAKCKRPVIYTIEKFRCVSHTEIEHVNCENPKEGLEHEPKWKEGGNH